MKKTLFFIANLAAFLFVVIYPLIALINGVNNNKPTIENNSILSILNIEDSSTSVSNFLDKQAISFNKQNKNIFAIVKTLNYSQAKVSLEEGYLPNLIVFSGAGSGIDFLGLLDNFSFEPTSREDLQNVGVAENNIKAVAFASSCYYFVFENNCTNVTVPQEAGAMCSALLNLDVANYTFNYVNTEFEAYSSFIKGSTKGYIASDKTISRIFNRINNGEEITFTQLQNFTDRTYFIGKTKNSFGKECESFVKFLLNDSTQSNLSGINLFNIVYKNYEAGGAKQVLVENFNKQMSTLSPFISKERCAQIVLKAKGYLDTKTKVESLNAVTD